MEIEGGVTAGWQPIQQLARNGLGPKLNQWRTMREIPANSPESDAFSKDLKHRGFSFVGLTVIYAHMQAVGMGNDHFVDCFRYREIRQLSASVVGHNRLLWLDRDVQRKAKRGSS